MPCVQRRSASVLGFIRVHCLLYKRHPCIKEPLRCESLSSLRSSIRKDSATISCTLIRLSHTYPFLVDDGIRASSVAECCWAERYASGRRRDPTLRQLAKSTSFQRVSIAGFDHSEKQQRADPQTSAATGLNSGSPIAESE